MSVVENVQFPAQPTDGFYGVTALGGDGFRSPRGFAAFGLDVAGDASGGVLQAQLDLDRTYGSVLSFITVQVNSMTAASPLLLQLLGGRNGPTGFNIEVQRVLETLTPASVGGTQRSGATWCPAPQIMVADEQVVNRPRISVEVDNVNGETLAVNGLIYLYDIDAKFKVPLREIFGGSFFNSATFIGN